MRGVFETQEIGEQEKQDFFAVLLIEASNLQHRINYELGTNNAKDSLRLRTISQQIDEIVESLDPYLYHKKTDEPHQYNKDDESLSSSEREEAIRFGLYEESSLLSLSSEDGLELEQDYSFDDVMEERLLNPTFLGESDPKYEYEDVEEQLLHGRGSRNKMLI